MSSGRPRGCCWKIIGLVEPPASVSEELAGPQRPAKRPLIEAGSFHDRLGAAAVQDTYKLLRTALHKLVKGHKKELPAELMPRLNISHRLDD